MNEQEMKRFIESMRWTNARGLAVPATVPDARPPVMQYLWAQIGWSELGEPEGRLDEVIEQLQQIPRSFWIYPIAAIMTAIAKEGAAEWQAEMIEAYAAIPTGRRVKEFVDGLPGDEKNRALFTPKPLMGLAKLALAYSPDDEDNTRVDDANEVFLRTYLKVCDIVEAASESAYGEPETEEDHVRYILRFWVQEGEYGEAGGFGEPLVRLNQLLRRIPKEAGTSPTPAEVFEAHTGMSLERFMTLAAAVLAYTAAMDTGDATSIARHVQFDPEDLVCLTHATRDEVEWVFDKLTLTDEDIRNFQKEDPSHGLFYADYTAFRLRPLWRVDTPAGVRYVPISAPFMKWRISDGLYWDVADAVRDAAGGGKPGAKAVGQFMTDFGDYLETYVEKLFERALPTSPVLASRFFPKVRTSGNDPELDLVIPYENAFVVIEEKAARFHYLKSVVAGDLDHIEGHDLEKKMLVEPVEQLDQAIEHFQSGAVELDGRRYDGEAVYPVLVTYGALPTMWPVWPRLLAGIEERGLLQGPNVRQLAALQVSEVEVLAALVARGHAARDVLHGYIEGDYREVSFRNYALTVFGEEADVHAFLKEDTDAMMELFREFFKPEE